MPRRSILIVDKEFSKLAKDALALMTTPHPIVIDYVDPEYAVDGERVGSIDYEAVRRRRRSGLRHGCGLPMNGTRSR